MNCLLRPRCFLLLASALMLTGCGPAKLNESKSVTLTGDSPATTFSLKAQSSVQKLKIDVAMDSPVNVYVFLEKDAPKMDDNFDVAGKWAEKAKASKKEVSKEAFTADIPANEAAVVVVTVGKAGKGTGTLKITN